MFSPVILECEVGDKKKVIEFYTPAALEFYLGISKRSIKQFEDMGLLPKAEYLKPTAFGKLARLYTKRQVEELIELFEDHYPVFYRGKGLVARETYKKRREEYKEKVIELGNKWRTIDYLELEPEYKKVEYAKSTKLRQC